MKDDVPAIIAATLCLFGMIGLIVGIQQAQADTEAPACMVFTETRMDPPVEVDRLCGMTLEECFIAAATIEEQTHEAIDISCEVPEMGLSVSNVSHILEEKEAEEGYTFRLDYLHRSSHMDTGEYNEDHDGLGFSVTNRTGEFAGGLMNYTNSFNNNSTYAYFRHCVVNGETLCLGYTAGAVSGYTDSIQPAATLRAELSVPISTSVSLVPFVDLIPGVVIALGMGLAWE